MRLGAGVAAVKDPGSAEVVRAQAFMGWFLRHLVVGIYPGSPYARKLFCMEALSAVIAAWSGEAKRAKLTPPSPATLALVRDALFAPGTVQALLAAAVDTWDNVRARAQAVLMQLPTPLPGFDSAAELRGVLAGPARLLRSPRVRETTPGAALLRLLFRKYVLQARWTLALHPRVALAAPAGPADAAGRWTSILDFLENLLDLLDANLAAAEADLLDACRGGLAHGTLLAVREVAEELPWAEGAALGHR